MLDCPEKQQEKLKWHLIILKNAKPIIFLKKSRFYPNSIGVRARKIVI